MTRSCDMEGCTRKTATENLGWKAWLCSDCDEEYKDLSLLPMRGFKDYVRRRLIELEFWVRTGSVIAQAELHKHRSEPEADTKRSGWSTNSHAEPWDWDRMEQYMTGPLLQMLDKRFDLRPGEQPADSFNDADDFLDDFDDGDSAPPPTDDGDFLDELPEASEPVVEDDDFI